MTKEEFEKAFGKTASPFDYEHWTVNDIRMALRSCAREVAESLAQLLYDYIQQSVSEVKGDSSAKAPKT